MQRQALVAVGVGVGIGTISSFAPGSADEVLEVLVLGQASLLAIVLSVSLLSVQVSTNQYAPQLSRVYRDGTFNSIMASFGVSILLALGLRTGLPLLSGAQIGLAVGTAAGLAAWSFRALFALEERLLGFLNPDPILEELVADVSLSRYRAFTEHRREEGRIARNPLLEIFQIARTGLEQNDNYSALRAVDALGQATRKIVDEIGQLPPDQQRAATESVHRLFDYWVQLAGLTAQRGADDILHALVDGLRAVGERTLDETEPEVTRYVVRALGRTCEQIHESRRLEAHYVDSLAVFTETTDQVVAAETVEAVLALAEAGVDSARLGELLATLAANGHRDLVFERVAETDPENREDLLDAVNERTGAA